MKYIRPLVLAAAASAASLFAGCLGGSEAGEATSEPGLGEAASKFSNGTALPPGGVLNVRYGAGLQYPVAYQLYSGQPLNIVCYQFGSYFGGSNLWYQLWDGNFVTASGVSAFPGIPACGYDPSSSGGWGWGSPRRRVP
jgi:hypothetical protein